MVVLDNGDLCVFSNPFQHSPPKSRQSQKKGAIPLVCAPYPQALVTLHNLLHEKKLRMVSVFKAAGMGGRNIKREDFIKVIKEVRREQKVLNCCNSALFSSTPTQSKWKSFSKGPYLPYFQRMAPTTCQKLKGKGKGKLQRCMWSMS